MAMQAWLYSAVHGTLEESLKLDQTAAVPTTASLGKDSLLVEVIAAAINPVDYKLPEAGLIGKFGVSGGHPASPGRDFCGRIVGKHVSNTADQEGDVVFGSFGQPRRFGTLGQKVVVHRSECAPLPTGVSPEKAAAVGLAAMTALQALEPLKMKPDAHVFVNGGSGGVGSFAIQFAKALGAKTVTTSCSAANADLCRSLGADKVIDYKATDVIEALASEGRVYDLAVDAAGNPPHLYEHSHAFLKPSTGYFSQVAANLSLGSVWTIVRRTIWPTFLGGGKSRYYFVAYRSRREDFERVGQWIVDGKVQVVVDSVFAWKDVPEAFAKLRTGHAKGKIVVRAGEQ